MRDVAKDERIRSSDVEMRPDDAALAVYVREVEHLRAAIP
jgi:hypothetical protein